MPCSIMCASAVPPCPPTTPGPECGQRQPLSPRSPMTARSSASPPDGESTSHRPTSHTQRSSETGSNSSCGPEGLTPKPPPAPPPNFAPPKIGGDRLELELRARGVDLEAPPRRPDDPTTD